MSIPGSFGLIPRSGATLSATDRSGTQLGTGRRLVLMGTFWLLLVAWMTAEFGAWPSGGPELHTAMEVAACVLALMAGILLLSHYRWNRNDMVLLVGVGFLGTGILDGYHGLITASGVSERLPTAIGALAPWSWLSGRLFLAGMLAASLLVVRPLGGAVLRPLWTVLVAALFLLFCVMVLALVPLGDAHFPDLVFSRPQEMLPGILMLAAMIGHISLGVVSWRSGAFRFWLLQFMAISVVAQCLVMTRSTAIFDVHFEVAHTLKVVSYLVVLIGLVAEISQVWRREQEFGQALRRANSQLEQRVRERTDELAEAVDVLERSNRDLQQFAYAASHDLKTPLRAISSYLELLQRRLQGSLDDTGRSYITRATASASQMYDLIQSLLDYSRVGSSGDSFVLVDLNEVAADLRQQMTPLLEQAGAELDLAPLPLVRGDANQLRQLLQNLLENALKYRSSAPLKIQVSAVEAQAVVHVTVADNGIGIDPKDHDRIFEVFRRLHRNDEYPGTGVGLSICQRIALRHGGDIWVESELGQGSSFVVTLPVPGLGSSARARLLEGVGA